jgi:hypothetical protein
MEGEKMRVLQRSLWAALALTAAVALPSAAAEEAFDLKFEINLSNDVTALLKPGDKLIATLQPQVQFGARTALGTASRTPWGLIRSIGSN